MERASQHHGTLAGSEGFVMDTLRVSPGSEAKLTLKIMIWASWFLASVFTGNQSWQNDYTQANPERIPEHVFHVLMFAG